MTESSRPPEPLEPPEPLQLVEIDEGVHQNEADEMFLESIMVGTKFRLNKVAEREHKIETPDTLYRHLHQIEIQGGPSILTTLTRDSEWYQLYQQKRWANVASLNSTRLYLLAKHLKHEQHSGKFNGRALRIERLQSAIKKLSS